MIDHAPQLRIRFIAALRARDMRAVRVVERRIDWLKGLLVALALVLIYAWMQASDRADANAMEAKVAAAKAADWKARALAQESSPAVRLIDQGSGFRCEQFHIRREWIAVVAAKCQELGGLITAARAAP